MNIAQQFRENEVRLVLYDECAMKWNGRNKGTELNIYSYKPHTASISEFRQVIVRYRAAICEHSSMGV